MKTLSIHALNTAAYLFLLAGVYFFILLCLDSHLIAEYRVNGQRSEATTFLLVSLFKVGASATAAWALKKISENISNEPEETTTA